MGGGNVRLEKKTHIALVNEMANGNVIGWYGRSVVGGEKHIALVNKMVNGK